MKTRNIRILMTHESTETQIKLFSDPLLFQTSMLNDIRAATQFIYWEIYRFRNDPIGERFRDTLIKKCREGVRVRLLIDSWGAGSNYAFFQDLIDAGGEVKFFKKIKFNWDGFTKGHRRTHRKILVIDDQISYIGSANISSYSFNWRESVFRIKGPIARKFRRIIQQNFRIHNKYFFEKNVYTRPIFFDGFEILRDVPSIAYQPVKDKFLDLINKAQKEIIIETPYFLPGHSLRKALVDAASRGVRVNVIIPKKSDVGMLDLLTSKYLGMLAKQGVRFFFYTPQNLHAKLFLADRQTFLVGSSNFDYRSFFYMHEICLVGSHKSLVRQLVTHFNETLKDSESFDYSFWLQRPVIQRVFEWLLVPFRHLF